MSAPEQDTPANASQASMGSNQAGEGAAYPPPDTPAQPVQAAKPAEPDQAGKPKRLSLKDKAMAGIASFQNKIKELTTNENEDTNVVAAAGAQGAANAAKPPNAQQVDSKDSEEKINDNSKKESRLSMEGLLKQARISFEKWIDVERPNEYPMPNGIVFLTSIKGSFGWGGEVGTGIVLYRLPQKNINNNDKNKEKANENEQEGALSTDNNNNNNNENKENKENDNVNNNNDNDIEWSGPCAIGSGGLSFGLQIGVSKIDHIIMLPRRDHVRTFTSKGQLKLGGSSELTVVNVGAKAQGSVNIGSKEASEIHSYSLDTKGLSIGVSVEGAVISIRNDCNSTFYNIKNITTEQIAYGDIRVPKNKENKDYLRIIELLNKHFKLYKPQPIVGVGVPPPGPHRPPHHPHEPIAPAVVGAALGIVGALAGGPGPHGGGPHGGPHGGHHGGPHGGGGFGGPHH